MNRINKIGLEDEYLITDKNGKIPSSRLVDIVLYALPEIGWEDKGGHVYAKEGYTLCQDSGYALVELITPAYDSREINTVIESRGRFVEELVAHFGKWGLVLLTGSSPEKIKEHKLKKYVSKKPRAQSLFKIRPTSYHYRFFGPATHVNISFKEEKTLIDSLNMFNALSGIFLALTARQKLWNGEVHDVQSVREFSWTANAKDLNAPERHNLIPFQPTSIQDYIDFVNQQKIISFLHEGKIVTPNEDVIYGDIINNEQEVTDRFSKKSNKVKLNNKEHIGWMLKNFWWTNRLKLYDDGWVLEIRMLDTQPLDSTGEVIQLIFHMIENCESFKKFINTKSLAEWEKLYWKVLETGLREKETRDTVESFFEILIKQNYLIPYSFRRILQSGKMQADRIAELFKSGNRKRLLSELMVTDDLVNLNPRPAWMSNSYIQGLLGAINKERLRNAES